MSQIAEFFDQRDLEMSPSNERQAMVPEGAIVLPNPNGTAPGLYVPAGTAVDGFSFPHLFLLPGPPRELKPMFYDQVAPRLADWASADQERVWRSFRLYGIGESTLAARVEPALESIDGLELGYCARLGEVDLRLIGASSAVEEASAIVREIYEQEIIDEGEAAIERVVLDLLRQRGEKVTTVESCTGGMIASTITNQSGASEGFDQALVTYANEAKASLLDIPIELIESHGAVSDEVVRAMAEGGLKVSKADHAIAVSGIAGPTGGSDDKPVGTVYVAIASRGEETFSSRYFMPLDRESFKLRVTRLALDLLRRKLKGFPLD